MERLLKLRDQGYFIAIDITPAHNQFGWLIAKPGLSKTGRCDTLDQLKQAVLQIAKDHGATVD